jgi:hypothetical protein
VAPQWNVELANKTATFYNFLNTSCLNGWTCGNIAARASDVAGFFHALLTGEIVAPKTVDEMKQFKPFTTGWSTGLQYGLGLMFNKMEKGNITGDFDWIGHAGQDCT